MRRPLAWIIGLAFVLALSGRSAAAQDVIAASDTTDYIQIQGPYTPFEYVPPPSPSKIDDPTGSEKWKHLGVTAQFELLRIYRNSLVNLARILTAQLQNENELIKAQRQKQLQAYRTGISQMPEKDELSSEHEVVTNTIEDLKQKIATAKPGDTSISRWQESLDQAQERERFLTYQIKHYDQKLEDMKKVKNDRDIRNADISKSLTILTKSIATRTDDLNSINSQLSDADEKIATLFGENANSNSFKTAMSAVFAGLVAVVIIGFFIVSARDSVVRKAIFSNESGIQFITLFSLVIAIILFGIIGILEGKELAALLGGLSGYILGRGTTTSKQQSETKIEGDKTTENDKVE